MALGPSTTGSERAAALSRMVVALEAAKKARDSGHNVQQVRGMLKAARSAFEAGDYTTAARFADQVLDTCGDQSVRAAGGPPRAVVLERISEALRATTKRTLSEVAAHRLDPYSAADELLARVVGDRSA